MNGKCDLRVARTKHVVPISIDGSPTRTLDLCGLHHRKMIVPVIDALTTYGAVPAKIVKGEPVDHRQGWMRQVGPFKCRVEGCAGPLLKSASTLAQHLSRLHDGMELEDYRDTYGLKIATPEERVEPVTVECPEGCETVYSTEFGNRWPHAAMISHMRGRHGLNWRPGTGVIGKVG